MLSLIEQDNEVISEIPRHIFRILGINIDYCEYQFILSEGKDSILIPISNKDAEILWSIYSWTI